MNRKVNILYTIPNFKTAGSQFVLLELYKRIDRDRFNPFVLVEKFPEIFPSEIAPEERLHCTEDVGDRRYISKLAKLLKKKKIDLVHSWDYKSNSIEALACIRAGVPYIYTKKNNAWSKRWFIKSFLSSHVVYNNPEMKNRFFSPLLLKNKVRFIPHGIDTLVFTPQKSTRNKNVFTVGCIGVIGENKNQLLLLRVLQKLPSNVQVHFYGKEDKDYKATMMQFIAKHDLSKQVDFKGFVANTEIPSILKSFDVLVLASKNEGLPLSIIEAMACGVPVLSSNSGGGARYLLNNDEGGFIFESEDALVSQIIQLIDSPGMLDALSAAGRKRVEENFRIEDEVLAYKELYLSLAT